MELEFIAQLFEIIILPLITLLAGYAVKFISAKINELAASRSNELEQKYLGMLNDTITDCVMATSQTYVESLKKQGAFDANAQKEAFNQTYDTIMAILSNEAKEYLEASVGDLKLFITQKIEAEVRISK